MCLACKGGIVWGCTCIVDLATCNNTDWIAVSHNTYNMFTKLAVGCADMIVLTFTYVEMAWPGFFAVAPVFLSLTMEVLRIYLAWEPYICSVVYGLVPSWCLTLSAAWLVGLEQGLCWFSDGALSVFMACTWPYVCAMARLMGTLIFSVALGVMLEVSLPIFIILSN